MNKHLFLIRAFLILLAICSISFAIYMFQENMELRIQYKQLRHDMVRNEYLHIQKNK